MDNEDEQLITFIKHGVPVEIIAKEMRRSDYGIICRMEKLGYKVTRYERKQEPRQNGVHATDVYVCTWSKRDDERLIHFYKTGMDFEQLANKFKGITAF